MSFPTILDQKFKIGEIAYRFGVRVKIVATDISPLGRRVYDVEEVYMGNVETVNVREDELSRKP